MKSKDLKAMKEKPVAELQKELREARAKLRDLKLDLIAGKVKNIGDIRTVRKNVARLLTFLKIAEINKK